MPSQKLCTTLHQAARPLLDTPSVSLTSNGYRDKCDMSSATKDNFSNIRYSHYFCVSLDATGAQRQDVPTATYMLRILQPSVSLRHDCPVAAVHSDEPPCARLKCHW